MIKISESIEDDVYLFILNFDEDLNTSQLDVIDEFWNENKRYFDEKLIENNYLLLKMTNLINKDSVVNVRKFIYALKDLLLKEYKVEIKEDLIFNYNKAQDKYELVEFKIVCPVGYVENGSVCSPISVDNINQNIICPIGFKWNKKLDSCFPDNPIFNVPSNYYWDFELVEFLPLKNFTKAKIKEIIKNNELDSLLFNKNWEFNLNSTTHFSIDANNVELIKESVVYNFYQFKWREFKTKIYIEIGKSLRENYDSILNSVYEEDGLLHIVVNERNEYANDLINEVKNQLNYYWEKMIIDIKNNDNNFLIIGQKNDKIYLKLEDGSSILVASNLIDLLK